MERGIILTNKHFKDLNPRTFGESTAAPGCRQLEISHYLIHYTVSGSGTFHFNGESYPVSPGEIFIIKNSQSGIYTPNPNEPWHYIWVGFDGELATSFDSLPPVTKVESEIFFKMLDAFSMTEMQEEFLAACLFLLYRDLFGEKSPTNYVEKVKNHIDMNFMEPLKIEPIARHLGLNRKYLSRIFKEETGISMKEYLTRAKMNYAQNALLSGRSVAEVASRLSYDDQFAFSKMFKKHFGYPPSQLKKYN